MANETQTHTHPRVAGTGVGQGPRLAAVGQATPTDLVRVEAEAPVPTVTLPEPLTGALLANAALSTLKAGVAGGLVGFALSSGSQRRSRAVVRGATVSATVSPVVFGALELARIQVQDTPAEVKAVERKAMLKQSGIALAFGAMLLGLDWALTRPG